jgi:hypothetical protein
LAPWPILVVQLDRLDDGVHRPEIIVSLLFCFEFHGGPSWNWHDCPERWQGFRVLWSRTWF